MPAKDPESTNQDDTKEDKNHPGIVSRHNQGQECKCNADRTEETDLCQLISGGTAPRIRPQLKREITWFFRSHGSLVVVLVDVLSNHGACCYRGRLIICSSVWHLRLELL